jgi:light-regulated signal transduction histidine kinase (bacteriophytochrome)
LHAGTAAANAEVERLTAEVERLRAELDRSNERLSQILRAASHDFAQPLQIIFSYADLIGARYAGRLDDTGERFLAGIETGAKRIRALVDGMFAYSELSRHATELTRVDCNDVVDAALEALDDQIEESGATVIVDHLPTVTADPMELRRLFENLLDNAIKFTSPHDSPEIEVSAEKSPPAWVFSVRDNGTGLDFAQRERIFEMFERLHPRGEYPGAGIGLAICKQVVERLGGRIWVESGPGRGSTFRFTVPSAD